MRKRGYTMRQKSFGSQLWRIAAPVLIQWAASFFVNICASTYWLASHMGEFMKASQDEQAVMDFTLKMMESMLKYSTIMTTITAVITLPFVCFMFSRDRKKEKEAGAVSGSHAKIWSYWPVIVLGITACIAANNILVLYQAAFPSETYALTSQSLYQAGFVVQILGLGIIAPIAEEMVYRGVMYSRLKETMKRGWAMFYCAMVFGLFHGNSVQLIYGCAVSVAMCYLYDKYGSVKAPIFGHIVLNMTSIILTKAGTMDWIFATPLRMGIVTVICAAVTAAMFLAVQKFNDDGEDKQIPDPENLTTM